MQTATARYLTVHPTELIQVEGQTEAGRDISIYIAPNLAKGLAEAFALLPICHHLGHAYWHVRENHPAPCMSCGKGIDRSAFEPEGGWPGKPEPLTRNELIAELKQARQDLADPNRGPSGNEPVVARIDAILEREAE